MDGDDVGRILGAIGQLEGKLDGVLRDTSRLEGSVVAQGTRIGAVEQRLSGMLGWVAGVGAVVSIVVTVILQVVER